MAVDMNEGRNVEVYGRRKKEGRNGGGHGA